MGPLSVTVPIALIVFAASFAQSVAGFGYGLIAIPLFTAFFLAPETALPLSAATAITQSLFGVIRFRKNLMLKEILPYAAMCIGGMMIGVLVLKSLTRFDSQLFNVVIGVLLLAIIAARTFINPEPMETVPWYWGVTALLLGGFICGLAGVGGPLIVLWVIAHQWDNRRIRVTLWTVFLLMTVFQTVMLIGVFGDPAIRGFLSGLVLIPVVIGASFIGIRIGNLLDHRKFGTVVNVFVVVTATYSIAKYFIR